MMTHLSPPTVFRPGWKPERIEGFVALARAVLFAERALPALWPALAVAGLFAAGALFGLFPFMPWPLHALILAACFTGTGISLQNGFSRFAWPGWTDGARRLEHDSLLAHRPISERDDRLGAGRGDALAQTLWRLHRARTMPQGALRLSRPQPDWEARDPHGLRYYLLVLIACGFVVARGESLTRLAGAFENGAAAQSSLDAWVDPPAYTGLPPVYLSAARRDLAVPAGSMLNLRVHGAARAPGFKFGLHETRFSGDGGEYAQSARVETDSEVHVRSGGRVIGTWNLRVIADKPPTIAFAATPSRTEHDAVKFSYAAKDDYGVASARVILRPHGHSGPPLIVNLDVPRPAKSFTATTFTALTAHPYAGLEVDATLEARDAAGHVSRSRTVRFPLPARIFTDPLARALIEQRSNLAADGLKGRGDVALTLDALTIAPDRFYAGKFGLYLALRSAYWGTRAARDAADLQRVEDLLWQIATGIEQGGLMAAAEELRRLQQLLTQALESGAPQDKVDALLDRYNQALQRYLSALAQSPTPSTAPPPPRDAKVLEPQDLEALLKAIQQLSQSGNREQAAQMLALLQNLLENMRMAQGGGPGQNGSPADKALSNAIGKLGDMMGRQRSLLDKTFRQGQGAGDPKDGGAQGLAKQQQQLQNELQQLQQELSKTPGQGPGQQLGDAGKAMGEATRDLGARNLGQAGSDQNDALNALRRGAEALAQQLMKQTGQGQGSGSEDPLGRGNIGLGGNIKIPDASDLARARAILQELRKRAGERGRPQEELNYIDRLLRQF